MCYVWSMDVIHGQWEREGDGRGIRDVDVGKIGEDVITGKNMTGKCFVEKIYEKKSKPVGICDERDWNLYYNFGRFSGRSGED